jgi:undecaprenyl-diphosphatase
MDIWTAVVLGIVEGISEFLPISSTGHLILTAQLLGLKHTDFLKSFEIAIQMGAILSVVVLYWRSLLVDIDVLKKVIVAFIPTGIIGLTLYKLIKGYLMGSGMVVLWSLFIGGIIIIGFEIWHGKRAEATAGFKEISYKQAVIIGMFQSVAMIPGVSRSAATIIGGLALGLQRKAIVEFSFLLAVPTMSAATFYDLYKSGALFSASQINILAAGFISSFVVALLSIKLLLRFIQTHTFIPFGIYRVVMVLIWFLIIYA